MSRQAGDEWRKGVWGGGKVIRLTFAFASFTISKL